MQFRRHLGAADVVAPDEPLPRLPVARALWQPRPNLATAAEAWILACAPHHTSFSQAVPVESLPDFADMAGIECVVIDQDARLADFKKELRWNQVYYHLASAVYTRPSRQLATDESSQPTASA